ncbi:unnamed protein product [Adineta ricciae]|uniref:DUF218 domain-containing protein n=1 Tax=Adineta ricciae TaxID=249248 RepID=A0A813P1D3_ADIRI|nr:unnamed protein product [Adineta ricciae]
MIYDCIVLPGGGVDDDGNPSAWVAARLDRAVEMASSTCYFLVLSRGTTHRPPVLDAHSFPVDEATASAAYLMERNIPSEKILIENWSLDTIVITNEFHMLRTKMIFDWIFSLASSSKDRCTRFHLDYFAVPNQGMTNEQLIARIQKEALACEDLQIKTQHITTFPQLVRFLFVEHGAYKAKPLHSRRKVRPCTHTEMKH